MLGGLNRCLFLIHSEALRGNVHHRQSYREISSRCFGLSAPTLDPLNSIAKILDVLQARQEVVHYRLMDGTSRVFSFSAGPDWTKREITRDRSGQPEGLPPPDVTLKSFPYSSACHSIFYCSYCGSIWREVAWRDARKPPHEFFSDVTWPLAVSAGQLGVQCGLLKRVIDDPSARG